MRRLPEGEHALTVEVDNRFGEDSALHVPNDYYSYGGITRPVVIEQLPDVFVERVGITTKRAADGWTADISANIRNLADDDASADVTLTLAGQTFTQTAHIPGGQHRHHPHSRCALCGCDRVDARHARTLRHPR